jgi:hypothetical protein
MKDFRQALHSIYLRAHMSIYLQDQNTSESSQSHIFTLTCHHDGQHSVKEAGIKPSDIPKENVKIVDIRLIALIKKEDDFKALLFEDLYRKITFDQLTNPKVLSEKIQIPLKDTLALYKGDLKKISAFRLLHAIAQFGYDIHVCMRPTVGYVPGEVCLES